MDKKILIIVSCVALITVVVCGAFMVINSNEEKESKTTGDLIIYGNANNDNYLNKDDVKFIQDIIDGKTVWDKKKYPFVDTNVDGVIDKKDIDLVNKFLNKEEAIMYYMDWNLKISHVHFPIKGDIAVNYQVGLDAAIIGGWYKQITSSLLSATEIANLDKSLYPDAQKLISLKGEGNAYEYDTVVSSGVSLISGEPYCYTDSLLNTLDNHNKVVESGGSGKTIDALILPYSREINGMTWIQTIYALGVMTCNDDKTEDYVKYISNVKDTVSSAVESNSNVKEKTYLCLYLGRSNTVPVSTTEFKADVYKSGSENYGDVTNLQLLPLVSAIKNPINTYTLITIDEILACDPDVIVLEHNFTGLFLNEIKKVFKDYSDCLKNTRAYKDGQIYFVGYQVIGSMPGVSSLMYMASMIWDGEFDTKNGISIMQDYYDKFTKSSIDIKNSVYLPLRLKDIQIITP